MSDQPVLGAALRAARKKIKIREGDQVREVPAYEALLDAIFTYGVKGNARYGGLALDMFRTAEQAHAREVRERNEFWQYYKDVKSSELEAAAKRGETLPTILPHPDDIVIDYDEGPRFIGPGCEQEQKMMKETLQFREVLIM